jgi:uncharacterized protein (DUF1501 family)
MSHSRVPRGMSRRHFLEHLAGASALALPAISFTTALRAHADDLKKRHKAAILLWMGGGPATIDLWDLKPAAPTGGPFKPISTSGNEQISEHLPLTAKQMHHLAIIRSMSTREADHNRGRYYMHTGYVPNPNIEHPGYGSVVSRMLDEQTKSLQLEIPPFVAVGGSSVGPGFLGMTYAPFVVGSDGNVRNLKMDVDSYRLSERMQVLASLEKSFVNQQRGQSALDHASVLEKTVAMMTSKQMEAFKVSQESQAMRDRYGSSGFGRGCLMARRLVEQGVAFVEVDLGGWDTHQNNFTTLSNTKLPELDKALSALVGDLDERGMLADTLVLAVGEFGRSPQRGVSTSGNGNTPDGRDHWPYCYTSLVAGAGIRRGHVHGESDKTASSPRKDPVHPGELLATIYHSFGIDPHTMVENHLKQPRELVQAAAVTGLFA